MAEKGQTQGAMDESQGWDESWKGLDASGPKDVISDREIPGADNEHEAENGEGRKAEAGTGKGKAVA